jgi:hypothetical protein
VTICCFVVISHTTHLPDLSKTSRFWFQLGTSQTRTLPYLLACFLDDTSLLPAAAAAAAGRLLHDLAAAAAAAASAAAGWLHDVLV